MRIATLRDFRDKATEMMRGSDIVLVTRDGKPAGFFLPWQGSEIPDDVRRGIYREVSEQVIEDRQRAGVTERQILSGFRASKHPRR